MYPNKAMLTIPEKYLPTHRLILIPYGKSLFHFNFPKSE